jgi:hypothetical protein
MLWRDGDAYPRGASVAYISLSQASKLLGVEMLTRLRAETLRRSKGVKLLKRKWSRAGSPSKGF